MFQPFRLFPALYRIVRCKSYFFFLSAESASTAFRALAFKRETTFLPVLASISLRITENKRKSSPLLYCWLLDCYFLFYYQDCRDIVFFFTRLVYFFCTIGMRSAFKSKRTNSWLKKEEETLILIEFLLSLLIFNITQNVLSNLKTLSVPLSFISKR